MALSAMQQYVGVMEAGQSLSNPDAEITAETSHGPEQVPAAGFSRFLVQVHGLFLQSLGNIIHAGCDPWHTLQHQGAFSCMQECRTRRCAALRCCGVCCTSVTPAA